MDILLQQQQQQCKSVSKSRIPSLINELFLITWQAFKITSQNNELTKKKRVSEIAHIVK